MRVQFVELIMRCLSHAANERQASIEEDLAFLQAKVETNSAATKGQSTRLNVIRELLTARNRSGRSRVSTLVTPLEFSLQTDHREFFARDSRF